MTSMNEMKLKLPRYKRIVTDMNDDLIGQLTDLEKKFYDSLTSSQKDSFLHMTILDRQALMAGGLSKEEEKLAWQYASTKSLQYINKSYMLKPIFEKFQSWAKTCFVIAVALIGADVFFNTYAKNRQLHLETFTGQPKYELIPSSLSTFNNSKQNINSGSGLMSLESYTAYISKPGFECGELTSISSSFHQTNGKPLCKKGLNGDVFVAGYVVNPTYAQPTFNVIHDGQLYNFDMSNDAAVSVARLPGIPTVTFSMIPYTFQKAFPEAVREGDSNVVTKNREAKQ